MKKKIIITAIMFLCFAGVVSASSLNGDYKGNPIVNIIVNGHNVKTEVPAMIIDGTTLIPLRGASEALGANVTWDATTQTANIITGSTVSSPNYKTIEQIANEGSSHNVEFVTYNVSKTGISMIVYFYNKSLNDQNTNSDYTFMLNDCALSKADYCKINDSLGMDVSASNNDIRDFLSNKISSSEFTKKMIIHSNNSIPTSQPETNTTPNVIESSIDGEFNGWTGNTIFKLMNGQIWQQSSYAYTYHYAYMPKVTIYKDGSVYKMMVEGVDTKISVTRIK